MLGDRFLEKDPVATVVFGVEGGEVLTDSQMAVVLVERHEIHGHFSSVAPLASATQISKRQVAQMLKVRSEEAVPDRD